MLRSCEQCGTEFEAKRPDARFHSDTCRKRAKKAGAPASTAVLPARRPVVVDDGLVEATRKALEDADRLDTWLGQQALALAARVCAQGETGASVASLSKELRAVMEQALQGANVQQSVVDQLRERRDRKRQAS